jgi:hypothetical protein
MWPESEIELDPALKHYPSVSRWPPQWPTSPNSLREQKTNDSQAFMSLFADVND